MTKTINPTGAKSAQAKKKMTKQRRWFGRVFSMKVIQKLCRTLDTFVQYLFCQERGLFLHKEFAQSAPCATIFVQATSSEQRGYLWSEDQKLKKTTVDVKISYPPCLLKPRSGCWPLPLSDAVILTKPRGQRSKITTADASTRPSNLRPYKDMYISSWTLQPSS